MPSAFGGVAAKGRNAGLDRRRMAVDIGAGRGNIGQAGGRFGHAKHADTAGLPVRKCLQEAPSDGIDRRQTLRAPSATAMSPMPGAIP